MKMPMKTWKESIKGIKGIQYKKLEYIIVEDCEKDLNADEIKVFITKKKKLKYTPDYSTKTKTPVVHTTPTSIDPPDTPTNHHHDANTKIQVVHVCPCPHPNPNPYVHAYTNTNLNYNHKSKYSITATITNTYTTWLWAWYY